MLLFVWCAGEEEGERGWVPCGELSTGMDDLIASDGEVVEVTRNGTVYYVMGTLYMVTI